MCEMTIRAPSQSLSLAAACAIVAAASPKNCSAPLKQIASYLRGPSHAAANDAHVNVAPSRS